MCTDKRRGMGTQSWSICSLLRQHRGRSSNRLNRKQLKNIKGGLEKHAISKTKNGECSKNNRVVNYIKDSEKSTKDKGIMRLETGISQRTLP